MTKGWLEGGEGGKGVVERWERGGWKVGKVEKMVVESWRRVRWKVGMGWLEVGKVVTVEKGW